jgi:replicative DNA helicase
VSRKWKHAHDLQILFIDYAQRITVPGADRITEVAQVARGMKNLARDLNIPVVALAQVVKGVDQRPDKRPTAGDLANSDELTREADQILMLYRDEVYNPDSQDKGVAEVLIEKNRHGPTGFKRVAFLPETMAFRDLSRDVRWEAA